MRTTFSSLWVWQCFQTLNSMCTSLLHLSPKSRQAPEDTTHISGPSQNYPRPPECPGHCEKESQLCREEGIFGTQLLHQLDVTTEPFAKAWFLHPLPSLPSAPPAQLLPGVPGGMACCNGLFLQFGPASCDISIRMSISGRGRNMAYFSFRNAQVLNNICLKRSLLPWKLYWWLAFSSEADIPLSRFCLAASCAIQLPK